MRRQTAPDDLQEQRTGSGRRGRRGKRWDPLGMVVADAASPESPSLASRLHSDREAGGTLQKGYASSQSGCGDCGVDSACRTRLAARTCLLDWRVIVHEFEESRDRAKRVGDSVSKPLCVVTIKRTPLGGREDL